MRPSGSRSTQSISIHAPVKGATVAFYVLADLSVISIHAPVKGATIDGRRWLTRVMISIHAPVKGATCRTPATSRPRSHFNQRSREGSDLTSVWSPYRCTYLNPRSHEGSDNDVQNTVYGYIQFQSTLP